MGSGRWLSWKLFPEDLNLDPHNPHKNLAQLQFYHWRSRNRRIPGACLLPGLAEINEFLIQGQSETLSKKQKKYIAFEADIQYQSQAYTCMHNRYAYTLHMYTHEPLYRHANIPKISLLYFSLNFMWHNSILNTLLNSILNTLSVHTHVYCVFLFLSILFINWVLLAVSSVVKSTTRINTTIKVI